MSLDAIADMTAHFGLTKVPRDIGDGGLAFIWFIGSVIRARSGKLLDLANSIALQIDTTGLTPTQATGKAIDLLIVNHWGEAHDSQAQPATEAVAGVANA